jgi:DNA-binding PadR family transcriptional regulator
LLDRQAPQNLGGPYFDFQPYDYGPFDARVYRDLERLSADGFVAIDRNPNTGWKTYRPTPEGLEKGRTALGALDQPVQAYVRRLSAWVRSISFAELVSAIYDHFPEMKAKSVFRA